MNSWHERLFLCGPAKIKLLGHNSCSSFIKERLKFCKTASKLFYFLNIMDHDGYKCGFTGVCHRCEKHINGCGSACQALGYIYHNHCFVCSQCGRQLRGENFYYIHGKIYCEKDFKKTSHYQNRKQCHKCNNQISNNMLQALGKTYHPECFQCEVCHMSLDGTPFTVDKDNRIYCLTDYHRKYSPRCSLCQEPIIPDEDSDETVRIFSMEKDFHPECFRCEDCRVQLQDETGKECYPLDGHLLCRTCNIKRTNPQEFSRV